MVQRWTPITIWIVCIVLVSVPAVAQEGDQTSADEEVEVRLADAISALANEQPAEARAQLKPVFDENPTYQLPEHRSVAYWLGRSYKKEEEYERALTVWRDGLEAMADEGEIDVVLADAYLQALVDGELQGTRSEATWVYETLIGNGLDQEISDESRSILQGHVAQAALLMEDRDLEKIINEPVGTDPSEWTFTGDAGDHLLRWWRRENPLPATERNERLEEHLERLDHALEHYADEDRMTGLDARGEIYIQYGEPYRTDEITYLNSDFQQDVFRFGVPVSRSDFPSNEIWIYHHIDESGYFIFIKNDGVYELGDSQDLIPSRLRNVAGTSERSLNISISSLAAMRYIYRELAMHQQVFSRHYNSIDDYAMWQEQEQIRDELGDAGTSDTRSVGVSRGGQSYAASSDPQYGIERPTEYVRTTLAEAHDDERNAEERRKENMPDHHTNVLSDTDPLPVAHRTARFLDEDGTTRTEVYWSLPSNALDVSEGQMGLYADTRFSRSSHYVLDVSGVRKDEEYKRQAQDTKQHLVDRPRSSESPPLDPQTQVIPGGEKEKTYHVGLQWQQHLAAMDGGEEEVTIGPSVKVSTQRVDSLQALNADPGALEMSDIKPLSWDEDQEQGTASLTEAEPYPYATIERDTPLALYFEVYDLTFGADDQTEYTIAYDVMRTTERGRLTGLFRSDEETKVQTETTHSGTSRTADEYVVIDLGDTAEDPDSVQINIRVTDEHTGEQKERAIQFDVDHGTRSE